jgi:signal transduction histidine kinase
VVVTRFLRTYRDWLLAGLLAVSYELEIWTLEASHGQAEVSSSDRAVAAVLGLALPVALAWRRRFPLVVLGLAVVTASVATVVSLMGAATMPAVAFVVAAYSAGAYTRGVRAGVAVLGMMTLVVVNAADNGFALGDVIFITMILGSAWAAGRAMEYHRDRESLLKRLMTDLDRERDNKARAAVAEERIRIARELHDVVAHAISVIVIQARGARRSLADDPDETREALDTIEVTGGRALSEMRRLLGMLRTDGEQIALAPQPSLRFIDELVTHVAAAGISLDVSVEGEPVELPTGIDVSAYRIIQEALTNTLKHAGPATARLVIKYGADTLELEVSDSGSGTAAHDAKGHGLIGMRERVSLYGGKFEAGPADGGGFRVQARLPLDDRRR